MFFFVASFDLYVDFNEKLDMYNQQKWGFQWISYWDLIQVLTEYWLQWGAQQLRLLVYKPHEYHGYKLL